MNCAVALVLLLDGSGSINDASWRAQIEHTADALVTENVVRAIERDGPVAVTAMAFSTETRTLVEWRLLTNQADATRFGADLRQASRGVWGNTDIGGALLHAQAALSAAPCEPDSAIIDVSTDGIADDSATGRARDVIQAAGTRINAIAVGPLADPEAIRQHVVTSDGFMLHAVDWSEYPALLRRKITFELAWNGVPVSGTEPAPAP